MQTYREYEFELVEVQHDEKYGLKIDNVSKSTNTCA